MFPVPSGISGERLPKPFIPNGPWESLLSQPHPDRGIRQRGPDLPVRPPIRMPVYSSVVTALTSVYAWSASWPISRPQPDCLYPPNGSAASNTL